LKDLIDFRSHFEFLDQDDWDLALNNGFPIEIIEWLDVE
jgi:hypothetical protein